MSDQECSRCHTTTSLIWWKCCPEHTTQKGADVLCAECVEILHPPYHPVTLTKRKNMEFTTFVRKPFTVEAVEITTENIAEIAEMVGTLRQKDNGIPYIQVDRRLVPNVYRVYLGFWLTKMGDNIRIYSRRIFMGQFMPVSDETREWIISVNNSDQGMAVKN